MRFILDVHGLDEKRAMDIISRVSDELSDETITIFTEQSTNRETKAFDILSIDEDSLPIDEQIKLIEAEYSKNPTYMVDWIDGIYVTEIYENRLSCEDFLNMID